MIRLEVVDKKDYIYKFKDNKDNIYTLNLEILDLEKEIKVGDYVSFSAELLNPRYVGYSTNYTFGSLENKYGRDKIKLNDIDIIKIETEDKEIYLKRLYG